MISRIVRANMPKDCPANMPKACPYMDATILFRDMSLPPI